MSIIVEHEKRRHEILEKALNIFVDEGFENATFQKIADKCGITRTTLYIYFKNKREIFNFSIKQFLSVLESDIAAIRKTENISHTEKLVQVMLSIFESLEKNRLLLSVVLSYLLHIPKGDNDPDYRVRRRTLRLRHILTAMLVEGINAGEFSPRLRVKDINELLNSFLEAAIFRMVVLRRNTVDEIKDTMKLMLQSFIAENNNGV